MGIASEVCAAANSLSGGAQRRAVEVLVVAPNRVYRETLAAALDAADGVRLVGATPDIVSAVVALRSLPAPPAVVLLDHTVEEGVEGVRILLDETPGASIIVAGVDGSADDVLPWIEAGAAGYVARDASLEHLLANIEAAPRGETLCSPRLAAVLINRVKTLAREHPSALMSERFRIAAAGADRPAPDALAIRLLGTLGIQRGGVRLGAFPTQRSEALFAYLVLHRERLIHRDVLCGQFWSEQPDAQARKSLRTTLWRIRSVVEARPADRGTLLQVEGDQIGFVAPSGVSVDVWELEDHVRMSREDGGQLDEATAQRLARVVQLYRGDFMEGHYDDWCWQPRERLREAFLTALERLAEHHARTRNWLDAIACGRELLRHDPLREHVHRSLMTCHHAMGDRPSALRQYAQCARVLRDQLAIEPMDETRLLFDRIRGSGSALSA